MATTSTIRGEVVSADRVQRIAVEDMDKHLATLEAELSEGKSIELVRGEVVIAEVRAPKWVKLDTRSFAERMPDFESRLRRIYGDTVLDVDTTAWISEDRDDSALLS